MIRKLLPHSVKVKLHLVNNSIKNLFNGYSFNFAKKEKSKTDFNNSIKITQVIKQTESAKAKIENFKIAIKQIEQIIIKPNEIFSFWKAVGNPTKKRGYVESRSITNGKIVPTIGGGLCQLSGLIYYACLQANIEILERYNHSSDIYTDETRFTPLGSDATVVFGYKDLKIRNNLDYSIQFSFNLTDKNLSIYLKSLGEIKQNIVEFKIVNNDNNTEVLTFVNKKEKAKSVYK